MKNIRGSNLPTISIPFCKESHFISSTNAFISFVVIQHKVQVKKRNGFLIYSFQKSETCSLPDIRLHGSCCDGSEHNNEHSSSSGT